MVNWQVKWELSLEGEKGPTINLAWGPLWLNPVLHNLSKVESRLSLVIGSPLVFEIWSSPGGTLVTSLKADLIFYLNYLTAHTRFNFNFKNR